MLSLLGLYLFITGIAGKDALNLARARALKSTTSEPVSNFLGQLDTERVFALTYLSAPAPRNLAKLRAQEAATGHVTAALRAALTFDSTLSNAAPAAQQAAVTLLRDAADLPRLHSSIASRAVTRPQALTAYNKVIGDSYLLLHQVILTGTSTPIVAQALALERIATSGEMLQQENALLVSDVAAHRFPLADQHAFTRLTGARATLYDQALPELAPGYRAMYQSDVSPGAYTALTALENTVNGSRRSPLPPPVALGHWERAVQGVSSGLERAGTQAAAALDQQAEPGLKDGPPNYSSLPGRFPSPRSPEDARTTSSAIQHGPWRGWSMPGQADGLPHVPGVAEDAGAGSSGTAEAGGAASGGATGEGDTCGA